MFFISFIFFSTFIFFKCATVRSHYTPIFFFPAQMKMKMERKNNPYTQQCRTSLQFIITSVYSHIISYLSPHTNLTRLKEHDPYFQWLCILDFNAYIFHFLDVYLFMLLTLLLLYFFFIYYYCFNCNRYCKMYSSIQCKKYSSIQFVQRYMVYQKNLSHLHVIHCSYLAK